MVGPRARRTSEQVERKEDHSWRKQRGEEMCCWNEMRGRIVWMVRGKNGNQPVENLFHTDFVGTLI